MTHAFEVWQVHRVALQTDVRNKRSWAAIERIGGRLDGIMRADRPGADDTVRLRVLFAVEPERESEVRSLIGRALASGQQAGPDGRVTTWTLRSSSTGSIRPDEEAHAARLVAH